MGTGQQSLKEQKTELLREFFKKRLWQIYMSEKDFPLLKENEIFRSVAAELIVLDKLKPSYIPEKFYKQVLWHRHMSEENIARLDLSLEANKITFALRHNWQGWENDSLLFTNAGGEKITIKPDATLLALGGGSWPRLGSDGSFINILASAGIAVSPIRPANCGFIVPWSDYFSTRFAGQALKPIALTHNGVTRQGEAMITAQGLEGGAVYALSSALRDSIAAQGSALLHIDLRPDMKHEILAHKLDAPRGSKSLSSHLRRAGLSPLVIALLREVTSVEQLAQLSSDALAARLKALPVTLTATTGMARAISTAGGIEQSAVDDHFMLRTKAGVFVAGEMLDWEAPTGGYLLQGCFSTGVAAAQGIIRLLN